MEQNTTEILYKETDIRQKKIDDLKEEGINPYAERFEETHNISKVREMNDGDQVSVAGRMTFRRTFGKFMFMQISDVYGKIQVSESRIEISY